MAKEVELTRRQQELLNELLLMTEPEYIENPFSGEGCTMEPQGVALHDYIKGCEYLGRGNDLTYGKNLFRILYPKEYCVLLD